MHYRLVSLWELIMQEFDVKKFLDAYHLLVSMSAITHNRQDVHGLAFDPVGSKLYVEQAEALVQQLQGLGLRMSAITAQHVVNHMNKRSSMVELKGQIESLHGRINDELRVRTVLIVPCDRENFYKPKEPLCGTNAAVRFPKLVEDMEEAGNCYALGRSTACVFHLARVMEVALRELGAAIGATIGDKESWSKILTDRFEPKIIALPETTSDEKARKKEIQMARSNLHAVRIAWRNDTVHPKETYTPDEAKDLIGNVITFVRHLATII